MKLLLTSAGLQNKGVADFFLSILPKKPKDCSILIINYTQSEEELFYVEESKKELRDLGFVDLKVFNLKEEKFADSHKYDVIYVCGGNTFSILDRMRITKVDIFIKDAIKNNQNLYLGVSAGSIIAGPNIEIAGWGSEGDKNEMGLENLEGFNFTNIAVFPHFKPHLKQEVEEFKRKVDYPVVELTDDQAIFITENESQIIN